MKAKSGNGRQRQLIGDEWIFGRQRRWKEPLSRRAVPERGVGRRD